MGYKSKLDVNCNEERKNKESRNTAKGFQVISEKKSRLGSKSDAVVSLSRRSTTCFSSPLPLYRCKRKTNLFFAWKTKESDWSNFLDNLSLGFFFRLLDSVELCFVWLDLCAGGILERNDQDITLSLNCHITTSCWLASFPAFLMCPLFI